MFSQKHWLWLLTDCPLTFKQILFRQVSFITTEYLREYDTYDSMMYHDIWSHLLFPKEMPFGKKRVQAFFFLQKEI